LHDNGRVVLSLYQEQITDDMVRPDGALWSKWNDSFNKMRREEIKAKLQNEDDSKEKEKLQDELDERLKKEELLQIAVETQPEDD
jgi:hypothetical protein